MTAMIDRTPDTNPVTPTTWGDPAPIALQRWESDGGACPPP
jgi:hypothetical protein